MTDTEIVSLEESRRLVDLEEIIEKGIKSFIAVGEALAEIRDKRLYRLTHGTFEDYCREEWEMSDRQARHLICGAEVVDNLSKSGTIVPKTESQARPLTSLPAEQQPQAWTKAVEAADGQQPTAKQVQAAVEEVKRPMTPAPLTPAQQERVDNAEKDSESLWSLKRQWRTTSKKDRTAFLEWCKTNQ